MFRCIYNLTVLMQLYDRHKKTIKKDKELQRWNEIDYHYMTEESEGGILQNKLTWRSEGMYIVHILISFLSDFFYVYI